MNTTTIATTEQERPSNSGELTVLNTGCGCDGSCGCGCGCDGGCAGESR